MINKRRSVEQMEQMEQQFPIPLSKTPSYWECMELPVPSVPRSEPPGLMYAIAPKSKRLSRGQSTRGMNSSVNTCSHPARDIDHNVEG